MDEIRVSMSELRQRLGDLVNRAAYGGERIILVSRGEPRAAIVGVDDLQRLTQLDIEGGLRSDRFEEALAAASEVRERIRRWQEAHGVEPGDAAEDLRRLREEHDGQLGGVP